MSPKSVDQESVDLSLLPSLPGSWVWCIPADVCSVIASGSTPKPNEMYAEAGDVPFIKVYNLTHRGVLDFSVKPTFIDRSTHLGLLARSRVLPDDVLINIVGPPLGKVAIVPIDHPEWNINQAVVVFRPEAGVLNKYLAFAFLTDSIMRRVTSLAKATAGQFNIGVGMCRRLLPLPMAPTNEQRRIVSKIEELFSDLDAGVAALKRAKANLKRYRAAVLKAAVEGKLTEEWRSKHPHTEPASKPTYASVSKTKKKAGRLWGAGEVPGLTDTERVRAPSTWCWCKVRDVGQSAEDAVQVGPMSMRSQDFAASGVPVLNVGCVQWGHFKEAKLDFLPVDEASKFERYRLRQGDVLFTRSGTVGRCAVVREHQDGWLMTFHLLRVRPNTSVCRPEYLQMVFEGAGHIRRQTREASIGTTRAGFNTNLLADLDIPLPPFEEQAQIIAAVAALLSQVEAAETAIDHGLTRAARLRQSILKQAFEGKLVSQDPLDEPASAILGRLPKRHGALARSDSQNSSLPKRSPTAKSKRAVRSPKK